MGAQIITTEQGEELVVLPRREYDALLASLGDEEAEDRMSARISDEMRARIESGEEVAIPGEIVSAILEGESHIRAARRFVGMSLDDLASAAALGIKDCHALDTGARQPTTEERHRIAAALGIDARVLEDL